MEKYWTKARQKHCRTNSKFCISMFDVRGLLRFPTPSNLTSAAHCSLSDRFHTVCSSLWQMSQDSGISNTVGSPVQSTLHFLSFMQWPLWDYMQALPCHTPGFNILPERWRKMLLPLYLGILASKARTT